MDKIYSLEYRKRFLGVALSFWAGFAHAMPGDFDPAFGNGGIVIIPETGTPSGRATSLAQLPDGSLLVAGWRGYAPMLAKLTATGQLDPSFGNDGIDNVRRASASIILQEVVKVSAHPDNRYTVVETAGNPCAGSPFGCYFRAFKDVYVRRITADGAVDTSYGETPGATLIPRSEGMVYVTPQGGVVVFTRRPTDYVSIEYAVVALTPDGHRDAAYEQRVMSALDCDGQTWTFPDTIAEAPDGKLLAVSGINVPGSQQRQLCVIRLNPDGSRDTTFGSDGRAFVAPPLYPVPFKLLMRSDGRILIVLLNGVVNMAFVWLTPEGALDVGFGSAGITSPVPTSVPTVVDVSLQRDDKILVLGYNTSASDVFLAPLVTYPPVISRLEANGSNLDASFGGARVIRHNAGNYVPGKVVPGLNGGIFLLGSLGPTGGHDANFAVVKLLDSTPPPPPAQASGGGCGYTSRGPFDPTLPLLAAMALVALLRPSRSSKRPPGLLKALSG